MNLENLARAVAHVAGSKWCKVEEFVQMRGDWKQYCVAIVRETQVGQITFAHDRLVGGGDSKEEALQVLSIVARGYIRTHRKPYDAELDKLLEEVGK